jgi:hypothetical protein
MDTGLLLAQTRLDMLHVINELQKLPTDTQDLVKTLHNIEKRIQKYCFLENSFSKDGNNQTTYDTDN